MIFIQDDLYSGAQRVLSFGAASVAGISLRRETVATRVPTTLPPQDIKSKEC
jgi:hypothetical protein